MKAHKGDKIVCKCDQPAGSFHKDVNDGASITSNDIAFTLSGAHDDFGRWVCPTCKESVAERFVGDRWRVRTRKGWLE